MGTFDHLNRALRWLREERGLRQYHLAEEASITKAMLSSYETGRQKPSLETLDKVLTALDSDLHELADTLDAFAGKERSREHPPAPERRPPIPAVRSASSRRGVDVHALLGLSEPLPPSEEAALEQVLSGFHRLLRYMHDRFAAPEQEPGNDEEV